MLRGLLEGPPAHASSTSCGNMSTDLRAPEPEALACPGRKVQGSRPGALPRFAAEGWRLRAPSPRSANQRPHLLQRFPPPRIPAPAGPAPPPSGAPPTSGRRGRLDQSAQRSRSRGGTTGRAAQPRGVSEGTRVLLKGLEPAGLGTDFPKQQHLPLLRRPSPLARALPWIWAVTRGPGSGLS